MRAILQLSWAALALSACGYPDPNAYPRTDRYLGVTGQAFTPPQAPPQTVFCYQNLGRSTDCTNRPLAGQDYRLVNAYVAPPPPGSLGPLPAVAPPPPLGAPAVAPPAPRQAQPAPPRTAPSAPLSLRPEGPGIAPEPVPPEPGATPPG